MFNESTSRQLLEIENKYQAEKKQLEIEKLEKEKQLDQEKIHAQEARNRTQKIIIISSVAGLILVIAILIILFRMFRQKKLANVILEQKNEEISAQRDEIEAQRDLAAQQRDLIIEQKEEITASIHYAYRIQSVVIPSPEQFQGLVSDYFIMYKPRDIVSGDFYWISKEGNKLIMLAADCTGHGVPGALMSMLGIAFLNDIIIKDNTTSPSDILNKLREKIIKALQQKGMDASIRGGGIDSVRDGMDVAILSIDTETNTMEFAGANNPLYIIKNNELIEIKGNKMPVAIHLKMEPFTSHSMEVQKGDTIFVFSDGFADQFGGPEGKKYKYSAFKQLLLDNNHKTMEEQKAVLEKVFVDWKGNFDQIDDVLVVGIRI
jgi:serine phosphatase RsbU (regulator of sigma subunit)